MDEWMDGRTVGLRGDLAVNSSSKDLNLVLSAHIIRLTTTSAMFPWATVSTGHTFTQTNTHRQK